MVVQSCSRRPRPGRASWRASFGAPALDPALQPPRASLIASRTCLHFLFWSCQPPLQAEHSFHLLPQATQPLSSCSGLHVCWHLLPLRVQPLAWRGGRGGGGQRTGALVEVARKAGGTCGTPEEPAAPQRRHLSQWQPHSCSPYRTGSTLGFWDCPGSGGSPQGTPGAACRASPARLWQQRGSAQAESRLGAASLGCSTGMGHVPCVGTCAASGPRKGRAGRRAGSGPRPDPALAPLWRPCSVRAHPAAPSGPDWGAGGQGGAGVPWAAGRQRHCHGRRRLTVSRRAVKAI